MADSPCPRDGGALHTWVGASQPVEQTAEMLLPPPAGPPSALAIRDAGEELALQVEMGRFTQDIEQAVTVLAAAYRHLRDSVDDVLTFLAMMERDGHQQVRIETIRDGLR